VFQRDVFQEPEGTIDTFITYSKFSSRSYQGEGPYARKKPKSAKSRQPRRNNLFPSQSVPILSQPLPAHDDQVWVHSLGPAYSLAEVSEQKRMRQQEEDRISAARQDQRREADRRQRRAALSLYMGKSSLHDPPPKVTAPVI